MEKNYKLVFEDRKCVIFNKNSGHKHVITIPMTRNILLPLIKLGEQSTIFAIDDKSWLRHLRYGHLSFATLRMLVSHEMVYVLPKVQEHKEVCEGCALGKHSRSSFPRGQAWRASYPLQLVHSDISGPMQTPSIGKNLYFLTFIKDYLRMCWV